MTRKVLDPSEDDKQLKDLAKLETKIAEDEDGENGVEHLDKVSAIIATIKEIIEDFEGGFAEIAESLQPHLGSEDIILTFGHSKLVLACIELAKEMEK
jgi:translation initiation factor 2B subunit (eIF-2B alpha/beta/delta family)